MQALKAGKHVVIEKPVAMSSSKVELLIETANLTGQMFFPYHNRRWDGDFLTLKHIIKQGYLGNILEFESHFDRWSPTLSRAEWRHNNKNGGGTLFDLGPHLIDQAINLFSLPTEVFCMLYNQRQGSVVNDSFDLKLIYPGMTATLKAGVFFMEAGPRFQVHGTSGSYVKYGIDPQEAMLKKGRKPMSKSFGVEPKKYSGLLHSKSDNKTIRVRYETFPGNYMGFYDNVFEAVTRNTKPEVTVSDALFNLRILEAALKSHNEKRVVEVEP
jgi:predicted dehydrogenase